MKASFCNYNKPTPKKVKRIAAALVACATGLGTMGYMVALPIFMYVGGFMFIIGTLIPALYGEE